MSEPIKAHDVVAYWEAAGPQAWRQKDFGFDDAIRTHFEALHHEAARGALKSWAETAAGALALALLLDQFPRNMYRQSPHAFATDTAARAIAEHAIARGFDQAIALPMRQFFYLPFAHSEAIEDQERAVALMEATGDPELVKSARAHQDIIARFGRFPHRNRALGRATTPAEQAFLEAGGFAG